MILTRRQLLFGGLAAAITAAIAPTSVPVLPPHPLLAGELGLWSSVRFIEIEHPLLFLVGRDHAPETFSRLNEGWMSGRIVWAQRWPRGIP